jgi:hypothetical protein
VLQDNGSLHSLTQKKICLLPVRRTSASAENKPTFLNTVANTALGKYRKFEKCGMKRTLFVQHYSIYLSLQRTSHHIFFNRPWVWYSIFKYVSVYNICPFVSSLVDLARYNILHWQLTLDVSSENKVHLYWLIWPVMVCVVYSFALIIQSCSQVSQVAAFIDLRGNSKSRFNRELIHHKKVQQKK